MIRETQSAQNLPCFQMEALKCLGYRLEQFISYHDFLRLEHYYIERKLCYNYILWNKNQLNSGALLLALSVRLENTS